MKKIIALVLLSLFAVMAPLAINAKEKRYLAKLAKHPEVESVYISPAAMKFAKSARISQLNAGEYTSYIKDIQSMEIINCDHSSYFIKKLRAEAQEVIDRLGMEMIMETKEDGDITRIYAKMPEGDTEAKQFDSLLIENLEDDSEYNIVYIRGKIDPDKISSAQ